MGFSDRLRAWLRGESKRRTPPPSMDKASRGSTKELEEFIRSRIGVEAFLEPKTNMYSTTLLLVADDGEYLRRPIKDPRHAGEFCKEVNIPLYDAKKVGYPKRMRDWDQGRAPQRLELSDLPPWPGEAPTDLDSDLPDGPPDPRLASTSSDPGDSDPGDSDPRDSDPRDSDPRDTADPDGTAGDDRDASAGGRGHLPGRSRGTDDVRRNGPSGDQDDPRGSPDPSPDPNSDPSDDDADGPPPPPTGR